MTSRIEEKMLHVGPAFIGRAVKVVDSGAEYAPLVIGTTGTLNRIDRDDPVATYAVTYSDEQWEKVEDVGGLKDRWHGSREVGFWVRDVTVDPAAETLAERMARVTADHVGSMVRVTGVYTPEHEPVLGATGRLHRRDERDNAMSFYVEFWQSEEEFSAYDAERRRAVARLLSGRSSAGDDFAYGPTRATMWVKNVEVLPETEQTDEPDAPVEEAAEMEPQTVTMAEYDRRVLELQGLLTEASEAKARAQRSSMSSMSELRSFKEQVRTALREHFSDSDDRETLNDLLENLGLDPVQTKVRVTVTREVTFLATVNPDKADLLSETFIERSLQWEDPGMDSDWEDVEIEGDTTSINTWEEVDEED